VAPHIFIWVDKGDVELRHVQLRVELVDPVLPRTTNGGGRGGGAEIFAASNSRLRFARASSKRSSGSSTVKGP
jgi:hypothetical protein